MDPTMLILDVKEKDVGQVSAPAFPTPKHAASGFPQHKKRTRTSAFRQQKESTKITENTSPATNLPTSPATSSKKPQPSPSSDFDVDEKRRIDGENRQRLQDMSPEDISAARQEIFSSLDPSLLQRLLQRASKADSTPPTLFGDAEQQEVKAPPEISMEDTNEAEPKTSENQKPKKTVSFAPADEDAPPAVPPPDLLPLTSQDTVDSASDQATSHFPQPADPSLDPSSPDFLQNLHQKYFPTLPADPSKLAWMAPIPTEHSPADRDSPYYPGQPSLSVSQLRFDFRGSLLPPRTARSIPVSKGLHHHGEAPEAAGYTILELARLARSVVPAQRCLAFQTLGRMLYRMGRGEWGTPEDELAQGLWRCFQEGRVLESLQEAAGVAEGQGHRGSRAYALEALWLTEKGGWAERWAAQVTR